MKQRCYNKNNKDFVKYGSRGIKICDEWLNDFMSFYNWSMENSYKEDLTIDRIDVGSSSNSSSSGSFGGLSSNSTSRSEQAKAKEIKPTEPVPTAAPKQKVTVDLTINGHGGDTWIIKRR